jgi:transposase
MQQVSRIGLDIAKRWFQIHGVSVNEELVIARKLGREEVLGFFAGLTPCEVALEASGSAHYWAREIGKLGHRVKLIPPAYVKPFLRRGKNDANDARAICEAASRPDMRFVPVKSEEQQAALLLHTTRQLMIERRTALVNSLRAQLAEFGIIAAKGMAHARSLVKTVKEDAGAMVYGLPETIKGILCLIVGQIQDTDKAICELDSKIKDWQTKSPQAQVLSSVPGFGPLITAAIAATAPDPGVFRSGRDFAAWIGLVPKQRSSGGKERLGRISKQGNHYLRKLLVLAAATHLRWLHKWQGPLAVWVQQLLKRRPPKLVMIALANKLARIAWAIMRTGEIYRTGSAPQTAA